jgi:DNA polymerase I-like protein with 3'-5' exonuclease and polymerase domains
MPQRTINAKHIRTPDELKALRDKLLADNLTLGYDIETGYDGPDKEGGSLDPDYGFTVGFSITNDPRWARYIPMRHDYDENLDEDLVHETIIEPLLTEKFQPGTVPHNAKFEKRWARRWGIELNVKSCTMIEAFTRSEFPRFGLKPQVLDTFGHKMTEISDLFPDLKGKKLKALRFNTLNLTPEVVAYACDDAAFALALHQRNYPQIIGSEQEFIYGVDMAIMHILCDMEDEGIVINWDFLRDGSRRATTFNGKQLNEIKADLTALTGHNQSALNVNSQPQLQAVLFDQLGMKTSRKTPGGKPSTDAVALESLSKRYPVVKKLLEFRELQARNARYLEKWPREYSGASDGRAHSSVNQCAVGTGRFAVSDPAYQQMFKSVVYALDNGDKFTINFRDCVEAPPGYYILDFDYSQVELRVMAGLSGETTLIQAFNHGDDVHTITAAMMLGLSRDQVGSDERAVGKTMNFALLYGMGVKSLSDRLAISKERATQLYESYFRGFSSITTWMERMKTDGKRRGFTTSWAGRKYTIWELQSDKPAVYSKGERVCVNAPVQGGAADYMKIAMVRAAKAIKKEGLWRNGISIVMNNHDALTFYVRNDIHPTRAVQLLREAVEFPVKQLPRIEAEFSMGRKWGTMDDLSETHEVSWVRADGARAFPDTSTDMASVFEDAGMEDGRWAVKCKKCEQWSPDHTDGCPKAHKGKKPVTPPALPLTPDAHEQAVDEMGAVYANGADGWMHVVSVPRGDGVMSPTSEEVNARAKQIAARDTSSAPYLGEPEEIARGLSKMDLDPADESEGEQETEVPGKPASEAFAAKHGLPPFAVIARTAKADEENNLAQLRYLVPLLQPALDALREDNDLDNPQNTYGLSIARLLARIEEADEAYKNGQDPLGLQQDAAAAVTADLPEPEGKKLVIELAQMPTADEFKGLMSLVSTTRGPNPFEIRTPEGSLDGQFGTNLTPAEAPRVAMIVPGARLYHPASEVSADAFADISL